MLTVVALLAVATDALAAQGAPVAADSMTAVTVMVRHGITPMEGVTVRSGAVGGQTDHRGLLELRLGIEILPRHDDGDRHHDREDDIAVVGCHLTCLLDRAAVGTARLAGPPAAPGGGCLDALDGVPYILLQKPE